MPFLGPICTKRGQYGPHPKQTEFFLQKWQKQIISFLKPFILSKYHVLTELWMFFLFCGDVFLLKRVISSHSNCGPLIRPQIRPQVWLLTLIVRCWLNARHSERVVNFVTNITVYYIVYPAKITLNLKEHLEIRGYGSYY